jgi:GAF domain-containing protein
LGTGLRPITDPQAVLLAAAEALGLKLGVNRVGYARVLPDETLEFGRDWIGPDAAPVSSGAPLSAFGEGVAALLRSGRTLRVDDAQTSPLIDAAARATFEFIGMRAVVVVPLIHMGRLSAMLGVQSVEPRVWSDDEQRLIEEVAERTWAAFQRSQAEQGLRDSEQQFRQLANNLPALCWMAIPRVGPLVQPALVRILRPVQRRGDGGGVGQPLRPAGEMLENVEARWAEALTSQEPFDMALPFEAMTAFSAPS